MLVIRNTQMDALRNARRNDLLMRLVQLACELFPEKSSRAGAPLWRDSVHAAVKQAEGFGFSSERDFIRFVSLGAELGWTFCEDPANAWMKAVLTGKRITNPSARLARVVEECRRRAAVAAENRRRRDEFCR
jgi:hypothetical protein